MDELLRFSNVRKEYRISGKKRILAVRDADFTLFRGESLGMVGESGCGKSTIGRLSLGIEAPTSGEILFEGAPLTKASCDDRLSFYRKVQIILQDPYLAFSPRMKIGTFLSEPYVYMQKMSRKEALCRAQELLEKVKLSSVYMERLPGQVSGGELQRIVIARAVAIRPELLICDEPTSALDVSIQSQIIHLLKTLRKEQEMAWLFITHDLQVARQMCDRLMVIYRGVIVESFRREEWEEIRHPYTRLLFSSIIGTGTREEDLPQNVPVQGEKELSGEGCIFAGRCTAATPRCRSRMPEVRPVGNGHMIRCWEV